MYRIKGDPNYIDKLNNAIKKALFYRQEWLDVGFKGAFGTALTFEYFLASKYDYETRFYLGSNETENEEAVKIVKGLERLRCELSEYCEAIDVGRLFEMRDSIDSLINEIHNIQN